MTTPPRDPSLCHSPEQTQSHAHPATPGILAALAPREREVLAWVAQGKCDAEIAHILGVSRRTVEKHVQRILPKLGCETRTAAARVAIKTSLLSLPLAS